MSNKLYTSIPAPKVPRNTFSRSRYNSLTMPFQRCCISAVEEILPGDKFLWGSEVFARLQPMVAPVMTDMRLSQHAFYVPLRTINNHFAEFMFNNKNGDYSDVLPYVTLGFLYYVIKVADSLFYKAAQKAEVIRLFDYIGLPFFYRSASDASTFVSQWLTDNSALENSELRVNLAPFFAYTKIWSEYFRDENLVDDPFDVWTGYGFSDVRNLTGLQDSYLKTSAARSQYFAVCFLSLRPRAWQHDRFTSALPFAQRGPDVLLPVAGQVTTSVSGPSDDGPLIWDAANEEMATNPSSPGAEAGPLSFDAEIDNISTTINDFRRAERLQRWYENSARGGVRPNEATLAHFGVRTKDATLDRAEFLGGTMQPIVVSEVAQTSETTASSPQGSLAGKGTSYKSNSLFKRFFTEHGFVFVFTSALVRPAYWQGIPRLFSRMQRDEYYWPEFALLGEEPVYDKELFVDGSTTEDGVFGYVPRYSDYKSALPEVHGDFRSSLDFWVNPRKFANQPQLNSEFIFGNPAKRMFAVTSDFTDSLLVTIRHNVKASRLMPFYGVPTI